MTLTRKDAVPGAAFMFGLLALITGSLTPLSLLVADMVVMWAIATVRHAHAPETNDRHLTGANSPATARVVAAGEVPMSLPALRRKEMP